MILSAFVAASLMLADVTPAAAAATAAVPAPTAATTPAEKPAEGRLVCRSETIVGTLMPKKTCYRVAPRPSADAKADPKTTEAKPVPAASN